MNNAIDIIIVPNNGAYETFRNISMFICLYNYLVNVRHQNHTPLTIKNDIKKYRLFLHDRGTYVFDRDIDFDLGNKTHISVLNDICEFFNLELRIFENNNTVNRFGSGKNVVPILFSEGKYQLIVKINAEKTNYDFTNNFGRIPLKSAQIMYENNIQNTRINTIRNGGQIEKFTNSCMYISLWHYLINVHPNRQQYKNLTVRELREESKFSGNDNEEWDDAIKQHVVSLFYICKKYDATVRVYKDGQAVKNYISGKNIIPIHNTPGHFQLIIYMNITGHQYNFVENFDRNFIDTKSFTYPIFSGRILSADVNIDEYITIDTKPIVPLNPEEQTYRNLMDVLINKIEILDLIIRTLEARKTYDIKFIEFIEPLYKDVRTKNPAYSAAVMQLHDKLKHMHKITVHDFNMERNNAATKLYEYEQFLSNLPLEKTGISGIVDDPKGIPIRRFKSRNLTVLPKISQIQPKVSKHVDLLNVLRKYKTNNGGSFMIELHNVITKVFGPNALRDRLDDINDELINALIAYIQMASEQVGGSKYYNKYLKMHHKVNKLKKILNAN